MKSRLNITIDENLIKRVKIYAKNRDVSVSELVENYFRQITESEKQPSIIDLVDNLEVPGLPDDYDPLDDYYSDMKKKHGP